VLPFFDSATIDLLGRFETEVYPMLEVAHRRDVSFDNTSADRPLGLTRGERAPPAIVNADGAIEHVRND